MMRPGAHYCHVETLVSAILSKQPATTTTTWCLWARYCHVETLVSAILFKQPANTTTWCLWARYCHVETLVSAILSKQPATMPPRGACGPVRATWKHWFRPSCLNSTATTTTWCVWACVRAILFCNILSLHLSTAFLFFCCC
jgi:hypothetical protein